MQIQLLLRQPKEQDFSITEQLTFDGWIILKPGMLKGQELFRFVYGYDEHYVYCVSYRETGIDLLLPP